MNEDPWVDRSILGCACSVADSSPQLCPSLGAAVVSAKVDTAVAVGPVLRGGATSGKGQ